MHQNRKLAYQTQKPAPLESLLPGFRVIPCADRFIGRDGVLHLFSPAAAFASWNEGLPAACKDFRTSTSRSRTSALSASESGLRLKPVDKEFGIDRIGKLAPLQIRFRGSILL